MQSLPFRLIVVTTSVVLLAALIFVVVLTFRTEYEAIPTATPRPRPTAAQPTASTALTTTAGISTAADFRLLSAGFAYQPLPDFKESRTETAVTFTGQSSGDELASIFLLSGGPRRQYVDETHETLDDAFEHFVEFFAEQDNFDVGDSRPIEVDGVEGRSVDLSSQNSDSPFAGRIVMAQPDADRLFVMTGVAPDDVWQAAAADQYAALLASVKLFAPASNEETAKEKTGEEEMVLLVPTQRPTVAPTSTKAPTPTPIPASMPLPTPDPRVQIEDLPAVYSNANFVRELTMANNTLWAATEGGILAWNRRSGGRVKFTSADGLAGNHFDAVATCPLPGLGITFGGPQGLQIFDPRSGTWNTLTSANSAMSYDDVSTVRCYPEHGFIVIGYRLHGLDIFDTNTNRWEHLNRSDGLENEAVEQVAVVGDRGEIWASSGSGISVLSSARPAYYNADNSPLTSNQIDSMVATEDGMLWIGGPGALHRINDGQWLAYTADAVEGPFPEGAITGIEVVDAGHAWLVSDAGEVCRFDADAVACTEFYQGEPGMPTAPLTDVAIGTDGALFAGAYGDGLGLLDGNKWRTEVVDGELLASNRVRDMAQTGDGLLWIAGDLGVQQMNPAEPAIQRLYSTADGNLPIDDVRVLSATGSGLWLGGLGAAYFDGDGWQLYTPVDGLAGSVVQAIAVDSQLRTWLGAETGLSIWNGETFFNLTAENGLPSETINALLADGDAMWIGSDGGGLYRFVRNQLRIFNAESAGLPGDVITALGLDDSGVLWVGTTQGLARFEEGTATLIEEVPAVPITAIVPSTDGGQPALWIGTDGSGVYRFDGDAWASIADDEPLPSSQIGAILNDGYNTVWIGGQGGGISRLESVGR